MKRMDVLPGQPVVEAINNAIAMATPGEPVEFYFNDTRVVAYVGAELSYLYHLWFISRLLLEERRFR